MLNLSNKKDKKKIDLQSKDEGSQARSSNMRIASEEESQ